MPSVGSGTVRVLVGAGALAGGAYLLYRLWKEASGGPGLGQGRRSIFDRGRTQRATATATATGSPGGDASRSGSSTYSRPAEGSRQPSSGGGAKVNDGGAPGPEAPRRSTTRTRAAEGGYRRHLERPSERFERRDDEGVGGHELSDRPSPRCHRRTTRTRSPRFSRKSTLAWGVWLTDRSFG